MFGPDHDFLIRLAGARAHAAGAAAVRRRRRQAAAGVRRRRRCGRNQALATPAAAGQLYELGGPRVYSYKELIQLVLEQTGRRRVLLPMPYFAWNALAALMGPCPTARSRATR